MTIQFLILSYCHIATTVPIQYVLFNIVDNIARVWFADADQGIFPELRELREMSCMAVRDDSDDRETLEF